MTNDLVIVPTGTANTASVIAAFSRLGVAPRLATDIEQVDVAQRVILPGVGAFASAMDQIDELGMRDALVRRIGDGRPTLAICVGMQLLGAGSEESPGSVGLSVFAQSVVRFEGELRVPQLGWNRVEPANGAKLLEPGWAYFANSYRFTAVPEGWDTATTDYGGDFVSAVERGAVLACQFHPELSGPWGAALLRRWLTETEGRT